MNQQPTKMAELDSLGEQLAQFAAKVSRPEEAKAAINRAFEEIEERGLVPGLQVGDVAPNFTLPDAKGGQVRLSERLAEGPVVLIFYRGSWCPYCNMELHAYQVALGDFAAAGANLIAVSPQVPDDAMSMAEKNDLKFDVLSDVGQEVLRLYRVRFDLPASITEHMLNGTLAALARQQPDGHYSLPVPATFVIDQDSVVRARHVSMAYRTRMEPADALATVREIQAERS